MTHSDILQVELLGRAYPIYFQNALEALRDRIDVLRDQQCRCFVLTDDNLLSTQRDYLLSLGLEESEIISFPAGETTKCIDRFAETLSLLAQRGANRSSALFAFGGGVIGDLAGFVAASYFRGIDFYQIPTSLLAMVDSSVGGKTGINLPEGKNLVGAFWQPKAVYIDTQILDTLPPREKAAGLAEVVKYGLLHDAEFFAALEGWAQEPRAVDTRIDTIVYRCCAIKAAIVAADETETAKDGGRALLNLGHTFGHAIENVAGYGDYLHGEAVAIGLVAVTHLSIKLGFLDESAFKRVTALLQALQLPTALRAPLSIDALMDAMERDKKNRATTIRLVVLRKLGSATTTDSVDKETIRSIWKLV